MQGVPFLLYAGGVKVNHTDQPQTELRSGIARVAFQRPGEHH